MGRGRMPRVAEKLTEMAEDFEEVSGSNYRDAI
jgi:hypothetical protein